MNQIENDRKEKDCPDSRLPQGYTTRTVQNPVTLRNLLPNKLRQMSLLHRRAG